MASSSWACFALGLLTATTVLHVSTYMMSDVHIDYIGGYSAAILASRGASCFECIRRQTARLVLFLPAFWLLVPGSLGLIGVTTLVADPGRTIE